MGVHMEFQQVLQYNLRRWHRNVLNSFWLVLFITMVTEFIIFRFDLDVQHSTLFHAVVLPGVLLLVIILLSEAAMRYFQGTRQSYALIFTGEAIATVLSLTNLQFPYVTITFVLPVWVSLFYFSSRRVYWASAISVVGTLVILLVDWLVGQPLNPIGIVTILGIMIGGAYLAVHITERAVEMLKHLKNSMESNQDLLIQRVMVESAAKLDGLTGAYNHKSFHEHMDTLLEQFAAMDSDDLRLYLLIIDIDDFKKVNDTFGHRVGDLILKRVADAVRQHCSSNDFLARYGGEEFVLIIADRTPEAAIDFGRAICQAVASLNHPEIRGRAVTISLGLSKFHRNESKDAFFNAADAALYIAKHKGKNQLVYAEDAASLKMGPEHDAMEPQQKASAADADSIGSL